MAETSYDVHADITIDPRDSKRRVDTLSSSVVELGQRIRGTTTITGGLVGRMVALGGAYLGFTAITRGIGAMTHSAIQFQSELEKTRIGLAAVISAVQGTTFEKGMETTGKIYEDLKQDALTTVATTQDLFSIFQAIVGPVLATGKGLQYARQMTNETVAAASALNIPFDQASREINMMVRGSAGMHNVLFAMLKSTGAIKESAEVFNKLTQVQKIEKVEQALGKFAPAAAAYGKSWMGVTSTFQDIFQLMRSVMFSPVFEVVRTEIDKLNMTLLAHKEMIESRLRGIGTSIASHVKLVFDRAERGFAYVRDHFDSIVTRIRAVVHEVAVLTPKLLKAAAAWQAIGMGRALAGGATVLAGRGIGGYEAFQGYKMANAAQLARNTALTDAFGNTVGGVASVAVAGGSAASGSGLAGMASAAAPFAAALALAAPLMAVVSEQWKRLGQIFGGSGSGLIGSVVMLGKSIWGFMFPILKLVGHGPLMALTVLLVGLAKAAELMFTGWSLLFDIFGKLTNTIYDDLKPSFDAMWGWISNFAAKLGAFGHFGPNNGASMEAHTGRSLALSDKDFQDWYGNKLHAGKSTADGEDWFGVQGGMSKLRGSNTPDGRVNITNDFRGSKIEVKQDFRDADPDNVLVQMFDAIHRSADYGTQSAHAPRLAGG